MSPLSIEASIGVLKPYWPNSWHSVTTQKSEWMPLPVWSDRKTPNQRRPSLRRIVGAKTAVTTWATASTTIATARLFKDLRCRTGLSVRSFDATRVAADDACQLNERLIKVIDVKNIAVFGDFEAHRSLLLSHVVQHNGIVVNCRRGVTIERYEARLTVVVPHDIAERVLRVKVDVVGVTIRPAQRDDDSALLSILPCLASGLMASKAMKKRNATTCSALNNMTLKGSNGLSSG
jgi:hypothetical protein